MEKKVCIPVLVLKNNLTVPVDVSLMNTTDHQQGFINQSSQYIFNMSCEGFIGTNRVSVRYRVGGVGAIITATAAIVGDPTLENTTTALNTLDLGLFTSYINGDGDPIITVFSSSRSFVSIRLFNVNPALVSDVFYANHSTTNTTGGVKGYFNCILNVDQPEGEDNSETFTLQYGTLIKTVVTGGDITDIFFNVNDNLGHELAGAIVHPGETYEFTFVNNLPNNGFGGYTVNATDNL